jgi:hypothetical protein
MLQGLFDEESGDGECKFIYLVKLISFRMVIHSLLSNNIEYWFKIND